MDEELSLARTHLFIAGTGRAGTSFLVRFLNEVGLDTTLGRLGEQAFWDENANAGLEDTPLSRDREKLPYVIKSPWLYQCIDTLLATDRDKIGYSDHSDPRPGRGGFQPNDRRTPSHP